MTSVITVYLPSMENWSTESPPGCLLDTELLLLMVVENHMDGNVAEALGHRWCYTPTKNSKNPIVLILQQLQSVLSLTFTVLSWRNKVEHSELGAKKIFSHTLILVFQSYLTWAVFRVALLLLRPTSFTRQTIVQRHWGCAVSRPNLDAFTTGYTDHGTMKWHYRLNSVTD